MRKLKELKVKSWCVALLLMTAAVAAHGMDRNDGFNPCSYVNPMIGSGGHGHVFVGANVPFGFVQLGPTQPTRGWDWCSGYHASDSILRGFGHQHLSGTGIGDLGDIALLPPGGTGVPGLLQGDAEESGRARGTDCDEACGLPPLYVLSLLREASVDTQSESRYRLG